jgi:sugar lactone lactonase YvrE
LARADVVEVHRSAGRTESNSFSAFDGVNGRKDDRELGGANLMTETANRGSALARVRGTVMLVLLVGFLVAWGVPSAAAKPAEVIVLPGASSAEGIAAGHGPTFYAGDLFAGDIFRGNLQRGTAELFIDAPTGRMAVGMAADDAHDLLFVAGGFTGQAYVYNSRTGATVATYELAPPPATLINDVALTGDGAWFTDSFQAQLYFVPVSHSGVLGAPSKLALSGPATDTSGAVNLNGIATTPDSKSLIVSHSATGQLYTVDPTSGASAPIAGVSVPNVDGIELQGRRLWAVQNFNNQVSRIRLSPNIASGVVEQVITSELLQFPATAALFGSRIAVVNAKFDTGIPPTADQYEVVVLDRGG